MNEARDPNAPIPCGDSGVTRFMLDTNVYDKLDDAPDVLGALGWLIDRGRVEIVFALPVFDQVVNTKNEAKRRRLLAIWQRLRPRRVGATSVGVPLTEYGVDEVSEFARDTAALQGETLRPKDIADFAIATGAKWAGAILVTEDKIVKRIWREVPTIWTIRYDEFAAMVRALAGR